MFTLSAFYGYLHAHRYDFVITSMFTLSGFVVSLRVYVGRFCRWLTCLRYLVSLFTCVFMLSRLVVGLRDYFVRFLWLVYEQCCWLACLRCQIFWFACLLGYVVRLCILLTCVMVDLWVARFAVNACVCCQILWLPCVFALTDLELIAC